MKILMTADTLGGVWTYALDLCAALAPHGVRVALATMGAPLTDTQRADLSTLPNVTCFESAYRLEWMQDPWSDVERAGRWLLDLADQFQPDLVHLNNYPHASLPWQCPTLVVAHSCVLSWWRAVKREPAPDSWARYKHAVTAGLLAAHTVVAPSRAMLTALEHEYGPLPSTHVIHNGRTPTLYRPAPKQNLILSAGRLWDEAKNLAALERIAPTIPWPIHVAGDTTCPDGQTTTSRHTIPLGRLSPQDLAHHLSRASIYALPARYEPFGLSVLEAALSGCALVLGDIPSLRELWPDAALFVPPDDAHALADALHQLIRDPDLRNDFSRRARAAAQHYTPQRMAEAYLDLYRQLTRSPNGPSLTDHATQVPTPMRCNACAS